MTSSLADMYELSSQQSHDIKIKLRKNSALLLSMRYKLIRIILPSLFVLLLLLDVRLVHGSTLDVYKNARLGHRIVQTRYGRLHGLILPLDNYRYLRSVEVFLGVPYATPPTKQNRFSPTRAPAPWDGIRISDKYSPVCPQRLPNISNETAAMERMPKGRLEYLKRLLPFLQIQSEDCLYLNIFSPINAGASEKKLPVIVFIHGESFEWNSGNPYDGSVLASYGEVVVVTLNYRLGILGFLNANPNPQAHARVANYGLMDQIAALHWIQQNIQKFGGDANAVTLAGHGTGAACINYLMTSPTMVRGLFQRAILMSGSAYASWALVEDPVFYALKLAKEVNCTVPDDLNKNHEQIVDCLREVALDDLYAADIQAPNFLTSFGPSVDGVVIRSGHANHDIDDLMSRSYKRYATDNMASNGGGANGGGGGNGGGTGGSGGNDAGGGGAYFSGGGGGHNNFMSGPGHYDVLFGVVTGESIWRFSAHDIQNGFEGDRRDKIIRTYVRNAYNYHLNEIFYTIVNEYTDWDRTSQHPINTRDTAVAALSDAQFVAPIIRTGDLLAMHSPPPLSTTSNANSQAASTAGGSASAVTLAGGGAAQSGRCYFYVFDYQTKDGDYPQRMGTVHGEDLPYIFGAPLVDGFSHFPQNYTKSEMALAEAVITFWTNFARTGNPNEHHRQESILPASKERNRFRSVNWDNYDPLHQKYLEIGMKPRIKNHFRAHQLSIWLRLIPELHRAGMEDVIARHNLFRNHDDLDLYEGLVKPDIFAATRLLATNLTGVITGGLGVGGVSYVNGILGVSTVDSNGGYTTCIPVNGNYTAGGIFAPTTLANASTDTLSSGYEAAGYAAYSTALSVTIAIGCSLLILNVLIFAGVYYQRDKTRLEVKTLQKQYQQRALHQQVPYPPDPIKHAHYHHLGHSQSANVIVDVENHGANTDATGMLLSAPPQATEIKAPPQSSSSSATATGVGAVVPGNTHLCGNPGLQMLPSPQQPMTQHHQQHQQQHQHQQQQQQQQHSQGGNIMGLSIANPNGSNINLNNKQHQQQQQQHHQQGNINNMVVNGGNSMMLDVGKTLINNSSMTNATYSTSTKQQQQSQQQSHQQQSQQQQHHMQIKSMNSNGSSLSNNGQTFVGRSNAAIVSSNNNNNNNNNNSNMNSNNSSGMSYNGGMMTLPKAVTLHHTTASAATSTSNAMNYLRQQHPGGGGVGGSSMTAALLDGRGNMLLTTTSVGVGAGDCMTLPRNLSSSSSSSSATTATTRHNLNAELQQYHHQQQQQQQQQQQVANKLQANGNVMTGMMMSSLQHGHIRAPRPPIRTASSTSSNVGPVGSLIDQTPSNGSSSSGVSSATSTKGIVGLNSHTHSHHEHTHSHASPDNMGTTTGGSSVVANHLQQQVPQAAMDEMRV